MLRFVEFLEFDALLCKYLKKHFLKDLEFLTLTLSSLKTLSSLYIGSFIHNNISSAECKRICRQYLVIGVAFPLVLCPYS